MPAAKTSNARGTVTARSHRNRKRERRDQVAQRMHAPSDSFIRPCCNVNRRIESNQHERRDDDIPRRLRNGDDQEKRRQRLAQHAGNHRERIADDGRPRE
jgi:hypothetical protein